MLHAVLRCMYTTVLGSAILGCQSKENAVDEPLTWKQVEAALENPNVRNIRDLFQQIADTPGKNARPFYANLDAREAGYMPLNDFICSPVVQVMHPEYPDVELGTLEARQLLLERMMWKWQGANLDNATRIYSINTRHANLTKRLVSWDGIIWYYVATSDDGRIIGWFHVGDPP